MVRPPTLAVGEDRSASRLELFFDLAYVLVVLQLVSAFTENLTWNGLLVLVGLFVAIWLSWMDFTLYANRFDTDDVVFRVAKLARDPGHRRLRGQRHRTRSATYAVPFAACYLASRLILLRAVPARLAARRRRAGRRSTSTWPASSPAPPCGRCRWPCPAPPGTSCGPWPCSSTGSVRRWPPCAATSCRCTSSTCPSASGCSSSWSSARPSAAWSAACTTRTGPARRCWPAWSASWPSPRCGGSTSTSAPTRVPTTSPRPRRPRRNPARTPSTSATTCSSTATCR